MYTDSLFLKMLKSETLFKSQRVAFLRSPVEYDMQLEVKKMEYSYKIVTMTDDNFNILKELAKNMGIDDLDRNQLYLKGNLIEMVYNRIEADYTKFQEKCWVNFQVLGVTTNPNGHKKLMMKILAAYIL